MEITRYLDPVLAPFASSPTETDTAGRLRASMCWGLAMIAVFNLGDIITTRMVLTRGGIESNPLAAFLLPSGRVEFIKAAVLLGLLVRARRRTPTVAFASCMWFVAGIYALTVVSNLFVLQRVG